MNLASANEVRPRVLLNVTECTSLCNGTHWLPRVVARAPGTFETQTWAPSLRPLAAAVADADAADAAAAAAAAAAGPGLTWEVESAKARTHEMTRPDHSRCCCCRCCCCCCRWRSPRPRQSAKGPPSGPQLWGQTLAGSGPCLSLVVSRARAEATTALPSKLGCIRNASVERKQRRTCCCCYGLVAHSKETHRENNENTLTRCFLPRYNYGTHSFCQLMDAGHFLSVVFLRSSPALYSCTRVCVCC